MTIGDHKFLFVAGLHRSGTSLLFRCLREHPLISGFENTGAWEDEGQHLQTLFRPADRDGGPGRFGFHSGARLDQRSSLISSRNADRVFGEWSRHWDVGCPVLLEKSPATLIRSLFFQELFPRSYFVMLLRHPIAVGYATQKWTRTTIGSLVRHWLVCHRLMRDDIPHLENVIVVRYEDFVRQPRSTVESIFRFIGLEDHPIGTEVAGDRSLPYFPTWERRLRHPLTRAYAERICRRYESEIRSYGYSIEDLSYHNTRPLPELRCSRSADEGSGLGCPARVVEAGNPERAMP